MKYIKEWRNYLMHFSCLYCSSPSQRSKEIQEQGNCNRVIPHTWFIHPFSYYQTFSLFLLAFCYSEYTCTGLFKHSLCYFLWVGSSDGLRLLWEGHHHGSRVSQSCVLHKAKAWLSPSKWCHHCRHWKDHKERFYKHMDKGCQLTVST